MDDEHFFPPGWPLSANLNSENNPPIVEEVSLDNDEGSDKHDEEEGDDNGNEDMACVMNSRETEDHADELDIEEGKTGVENIGSNNPENSTSESNVVAMEPIQSSSSLESNSEEAGESLFDEDCCAITIDRSMIPERPSSSPPQLMSPSSSVSSVLPPLRDRAVSAADMNIDESAPAGYLYLNGRRRRANSMEPVSSSAALSSSTQHDSHKVPNECAICLTGYEKGETIVTSCNADCPHAFHQECIVEWLVKMQDGAPCPCCRRTFVELDAHIPRAGGNNSNSNNNVQNAEELERQRQERRRRHIEEGIIRGGRGFNTSVISLR